MHGNISKLRIPHQCASPVLAILGLTDRGSAGTNVIKHSTLAKQSKPSAADPVGCTTITGISSYCTLPQDYAKR